MLSPVLITGAVAKDFDRPMRHGIQQKQNIRMMLHSLGIAEKYFGISMAPNQYEK
jgi:hypothetical protein